jgi:hypothetical protein
LQIGEGVRHKDSAGIVSGKVFGRKIKQYKMTHLQCYEQYPNNTFTPGCPYYEKATARCESSTNFNVRLELCCPHGYIEGNRYGYN